MTLLSFRSVSCLTPRHGAKLPSSHRKLAVSAAGFLVFVGVLLSAVAAGHGHDLLPQHAGNVAGVAIEMQLAGHLPHVAVDV